MYFGGCPVAVIGSTMYPVQEFYLEDVLLQTDYVKPTATKSDPLLRALCKTKPVYTCDMCKRKGFRSAVQPSLYHQSTRGLSADQ